MSAGMELILDAEATLALSDRQAVENWVRAAADLAGMRIIGAQSHVLPNGHDNGPGVTAVAVIAESHVAVHTFPELGVISMSFYSCRPFDHTAIQESFRLQFGVTRVLLCTVIERALGYVRA